MLRGPPFHLSPFTPSSPGSSLKRRPPPRSPFTRAAERRPVHQRLPPPARPPLPSPWQRRPAAAAPPPPPRPPAPAAP
ncbi:MAG: hypothetical protein CVV20_04020, partial [Gemmatimonadetes bacterium HGW-Gemmatimonadetes-1]